MVSTRRSRARSAASRKEAASLEKDATDETTSHENKHDDDADSSKAEDEEPPQPVSSSSEGDEGSDDDEEGDSESSSDELADKKNRDHTPNATSSNRVSAATALVGSSRLFTPYRTVGVVSSGAFFLLPNQNSAQAVAVCAIRDRFQMLQTDRLHPVLVSRTAGSWSQLPLQPTGNGDGAMIEHLVSDASLSITVTSDRAGVVTLFSRAMPLVTHSVCKSNQWSVVTMISLGRIRRLMDDDPEKKDKFENTAVVALVLSREKDDDDDGTVPVLGNDSDLDSSDDEADPYSSSKKETCRGQIVLLVCSRTTMSVHKRIKLDTIPTFQPFSAVHPATYLNKVVLGGSLNGTASLCLVNVRSGNVVHTFDCLRKSTDFSVTALEQAPAVDTIAVGTNGGKVHLVNLKHDKKLFSLRHKGANGKSVEVTSLSFRTDGSAMQYGIAPMAVGRSDGSITVWDLTAPDDPDISRTILCEMKRVHPGGVAKLEYFPQEPLLVSTGTTSNSILMHIFDNPDHSGRLLRARKGHVAPPCRIQYLHAGAGAGGGILANMSDGTDARACQILSSGGLDRTLRVFSTARTVLDKEYSQGQGLEKKARKLGLHSKAELLLPPLTSMAMSEARSRDWGDLVTIHEDHPFAYVWSTKRGAQSGPILRQENWNVSAMKRQPPRMTHATSVAISACGSFALVGTRGGTIYRYNVQSGIARGTYPNNTNDSSERATKDKAIGDVNRTMKALEKKLKTTARPSNLEKQKLDEEDDSNRKKLLQKKLQSASHGGFAVTGIAVDSVNKTLISVGSDAKLILWNFSSHAPHKKSPFLLPSPATRMRHVRESDLAAIALDDFSVVLFDCTAQSIVRQFGKDVSQHRAAISDLCFSPDGRSLFTCSLDSTIRVWDVPTNSCVDWLGFKAPPTSLTVSPTGEYIATSHVGRLGLSIWSDKSFYQTVHVDGAPLLEPARMDDPIPVADENGSDIADILLLPHANATQTEKEPAEKREVAPLPKESGIITLSGLPTAHWKTLFHLELVKERNKPSEAPKKPPSAPFFLQWRGGEEKLPPEDNTIEKLSEKDDWAAAWSDDEDDKNHETTEKSEESLQATDTVPNKKRKVQHHRSHLASLLKECSLKDDSEGPLFLPVTEYIGTIGPSAIDVALSSLCSGMHDLVEGLPLLLFASQWLLEACSSRERFEAVNAYLHRFLHLHAVIIAGIEEFSGKSDDAAELTQDEAEEKEQEKKDREALLDTVSKLKIAQQAASDRLREKMEHTLCLLRHFSRMV